MDEPPPYRLTITCDVHCDDIDDTDIREFVRFSAVTADEREAAVASAIRQRQLLAALRADRDALEAFLAHALAEPVADRIEGGLARLLGSDGELYFAIRAALERLPEDDQHAFAVSEADGEFYDDTELVRGAVRVRVAQAVLVRGPHGGAPLPCPFCGSSRAAVHPPERPQKGERGAASGFVRCEACGARGPAAAEPGDAVARWNDRTPERDQGSIST